MSAGDSEVHLLDVGRGQYGDCVLCRFNRDWVLIDGGHRGDLTGSPGHAAIPTQLRLAMGLGPDQTIALNLLVVSHAHDDHIGCLPELVGTGVLTAEWSLLVDPDLAWSPVEQDAARPANRLFAILREEPKLDVTDAIAFDAALADAANLQARYRSMIRTLRTAGTHVVLHGKSPTKALLGRFAGIGMEILGPTRAALKACSALIDGVGRDFIAEADAILVGDNDQFSFYRHLIGTWTDGTDSGGGFGPAINMQSSVLAFHDGRHRFLFSGDAQLEKSEVPSKEVASSVQATLSRIRALAPFDFVKVGHHGSYNAVGTRLLTELGQQTVNFGICTGADSRHHPSVQALGSLKQHSEDLRLGRTDQNGRVTFAFHDGTVAVTPEKGDLNDWSGPRGRSIDTALPNVPPSETIPTAPTPVVTTVPISPGSTPCVEVKIPYDPGVGLDVTLTLKIAPVTPSVPPRTRTDVAFRLADGRPLPALLFVTHSQRLSNNVGDDTVRSVASAIAAAGQTLHDLGAAGSETISDAVRSVRAQLGQGTFHGVVLIGGYDVVPSERRDVADDRPKKEALRNRDPDEFIVWSDNAYGDVDGDLLPELPVSRVPDGHSAKGLLQALSAPAANLQERFGVRNMRREYAEAVFESLTGAAPMLCSHPHSSSLAPFETSGDHLYLMLHGASEDATRFWGEDDDGAYLEAIGLDNIRVRPGTVVFTGCCWGALPVLEPAVVPGAQTSARTAGDSIALRCVAQGALAFIGCTGVHYSPKEPPYNHSGALFHQLFWRYLLQPLPPAKALFEARKEFAAGISRRSRDAFLQSIDRKMFEQFTLLGLGW